MKDDKLRNPVKAIRAKCIDCGNGQQKEVELCPVVRCPLHPFRLGKNPYRTKTKRVWTDEERAAAAERMRKLQSNKREKAE